MLRIIGAFTMATAFLLISPSLRESVLLGLGQATLQLAKYSPYSYILLALGFGVFAVKSLAMPKPQ
jgi:hypothetical protein